ncbi:hypothetical protein [Tabrizicola fusiformis]|uniref:hypothetical protein n=1 Tax=Tabrizicola sp. SY72 TaxID=2741673 RepID=UPI001573EAE5|nr:hypothetical protein [Tabrizicola sp. SY72]NTT85805.1 hypothetical protein [Tabrizicola sp. SY72]
MVSGGAPEDMLAAYDRQRAIIEQQSVVIEDQHSEIDRMKSKVDVLAKQVDSLREALHGNRSVWASLGSVAGALGVVLASLALLFVFLADPVEYGDAVALKNSVGTELWQLDACLSAECNDRGAIHMAQDAQTGHRFFVSKTE